MCKGLVFCWTVKDVWACLLAVLAPTVNFLERGTVHIKVPGICSSVCSAAKLRV